jgi:hypothetical protein
MGRCLTAEFVESAASQVDNNATGEPIVIQRRETFGSYRVLLV